MAEDSGSKTLLGVVNEMEKKRQAEEADRAEEQAGIVAAKKRTEDYISNSGGSQGNLEVTPGASGTGDVVGEATGGHTEKKKPGLNPS